MAETEVVDKFIRWTTPPCYTEAVLTTQPATVQLTSAQSGSLFVFDSAAGIVYTLPTCVKGLTYSFLVTVTITSGAAEVATKTVASEFVVGGVIATGLTGTPVAVPFSANGTSHVAVKMNGTTTGGVIGSYFTLTAISSTQWGVTGQSYSTSGQTLATPFSTTV